MLLVLGAMLACVSCKSIPPAENERDVRERIIEVEENPEYDIFWKAIVRSDADSMRRMMTQCDLTGKDGYGRNTCLSLAISYDNVAAVEMLLDAGIDPNERDFDGGTALHEAARVGKSIQTLEALLKHGADVNAQETNGWTAVMHTVSPYRGDPNPAHAQLLIEAGADLQLVNDNAQDMLLRTAICNPGDDFIRVVWDAVAEANPERLNDPVYLAQLAVWTTNDTLLVMLKTRAEALPSESPRPRENESLKSTLIRQLLETGVKADTRDGRGRTLLTMACEFSDIDTLSALIAAGADVNAHSVSGWTPLMAAAYKGGAEAITLLLRAGANIHTKDHMGRTALHYAAWQNPNLLATVTLLRAGADIHARTDDNMTPLDCAINNYNNRSLDIAWLLYKLGADIHSRGSYNQPVLLNIAYRHQEQPAFFRELLDADADAHLTKAERGEVLIRAFCACVDEARIWKLLHRGIDPRQNGIIESAADSDNSSGILAFLIKRGARIDPTESTLQNANERSALTIATEYRNWKNVELLLKAGAATKTNGLDYRYHPVLLPLARMSGALTPEIIARLHDAGDSVNAMEYDDGRQTVLMLAATHYTDPRVITTLLRLGADPNAQDAEGKTALDYLRANKRLNRTAALDAMQKAMTREP